MVLIQFLVLVGEMQTLEVIGKLVYNIACSPKEPKYRSVKLTNAKIKALIVDTPGAYDAMLCLGWEASTDSSGDSILTIDKTITMAQVRCSVR